MVIIPIDNDVMLAEKDKIKEAADQLTSKMTNLFETIDVSNINFKPGGNLSISLRNGSDEGGDADSVGNSGLLTVHESGKMNGNGKANAGNKSESAGSGEMRTKSPEKGKS